MLYYMSTIFINSHQDLLMQILYALSFRFYEYESINTMFLYRKRDLITSENNILYQPQ